MVLGLITGATTIEVRVASKVRVSQFSVQSNDLLYRTTTQRRPMYSISTDSISMKTNCSDFEDGAEVNDRPVREIRGNSKKKSGKRAQAQTKRSLAIEQEGGTLC